MIENEASYLVKTLPSLDGVLRKDIEQHYLSDGDEPLRLRRSGSTFELTKKLTLDADDLSRKEEITVPLTADEYYQLLPLAKRSLSKTRYFIRLPNGLTAELDAFREELKGLTMVEVEFPNEQARTDFKPPRWFGRDVSQEAWSMNSSLAGKTFAAVRKHLAEPKAAKGGPARNGGTAKARGRKMA